MKLGTENRTQVVALAVLGGLALLLLVRTFWPSEPSPTAAMTPATSSSTPRPATRRTASGKTVVITEPRLDPTLNFDLLRESEEIKYTGNGRNIFANSVPIEKPIQNGTDQAVQVPVYTPPVVAPPPPITLKFFGFASKPGEPKRVFLSQNEDVFIAGEGDIVDRRYRVLRISNTPPAVEVEDVLNNHKQTLPLVQG